MDQRSLSPQTLAAQGLGEADPATGALAPVISLSTNYEQQPDGSYRQSRAYTRADNPTSEHAERLLAALEGGECAARRATMSGLRAGQPDEWDLSAGPLVVARVPGGFDDDPFPH